jgi:hypothetical protein
MSGRRRQPRLLLGAILLTAVSGYTVFAIVRALVLAAEGARDSWYIWPALLLLGLIARWTGTFAIRLWRRIAADRRAVKLTHYP